MFNFKNFVVFLGILTSGSCLGNKVYINEIYSVEKVSSEDYEYFNGLYSSSDNYDLYNYLAASFFHVKLKVKCGLLFSPKDLINTYEVSTLRNNLLKQYDPIYFVKIDELMDRESCERIIGEGSNFFFHFAQIFPPPKWAR